MRAPPLGLSQLATSFIACPRLGIPRAPLPRLASIPLAPPGPNTPNALDLSFSLPFPSTQIVKQLNQRPEAPSLQC
jgi:hypothetical protein